MLKLTCFCIKRPMIYCVFHLTSLNSHIIFMFPFWNRKQSRREEKNGKTLSCRVLKTEETMHYGYMWDIRLLAKASSLFSMRRTRKKSAFKRKYCNFKILNVLSLLYTANVCFAYMEFSTNNFHFSKRVIFAFLVNVK